jgi:chondroitin AC lyase
MHSDRNKNMEEPYNEEGLKNHHYADGSNFISLKGNEYQEIFPVFDWQKIPGTTVVQKTNLPHWNQIAKRGLKSFVGGVSDGIYGAAAFDFQSPHDPLQARKSWFFFDEEYVCLGAGIQSASEYPVSTTLNQCLLSKDVLVNRNGQEENLGKSEHQLDNTSWVLHDGIAYYFPSKANLRLSNTMAKGNWRQINHHPWATDDVVQKEVFTLWFDHGVNPENASYEYVIIPEMTASKLAAYSTKKGIQVLSNTSDLQAVKHASLNMSQLVFYKHGKIDLGEGTIEALQPCMLMVKTNGNHLEQLTVSDPTHKLDLLRFEISTAVNGIGTNWKATWNEKRKVSEVEVTLPKEGDAGKSVVIKLG